MFHLVLAKMTSKNIVIFSMELQFLRYVGPFVTLFWPDLDHKGLWEWGESEGIRRAFSHLKNRIFSFFKSKFDKGRLGRLMSRK